MLKRYGRMRRRIQLHYARLSVIRSLFRQYEFEHTCWQH